MSHKVVYTTESKLVLSHRNRSDIAALGAMPDAARLQAGYLPQFARQAGTVSTIVLLNSGGVSQTITVTAAITDLNGGGLVSKLNQDPWGLVKEVPTLN